MKPISSNEVQRAIVSLSVGETALEKPKRPTFTPEEKEYYRALREAVIYLDTYLAKGPGFAHAPAPAKGTEEYHRQQDWIVGYARPLKLAGVSRIDLMPAADRFMAKSGDVKYFPTPPQLIDCADACRADRLAKEPPPKPPPALPEPPMDRDKWNSIRVHHGRPPLPEFAHLYRRDDESGKWERLEATS